MDGKEYKGSSSQGSPDPESCPSLFRYITYKSVAGFDVTPSPRGDPTFAEVSHDI